jgi:hypothetical protein
MQLIKSFIIGVSLPLILCFSIVNPAVQAQKDSALFVIQQHIELLNQNNWTAIPALWVKEEQNSLMSFITSSENQKNKLGLFNIKKAHLVAWRELPFEYGKHFLPRYIEKFTNPRVFYVAVDYSVYREDKYHINGVNYFLVCVASEENQWKIVLTPHVPVNSLITDGYGFGTDDEKTFDERRLRFVH